MDQVIPLAESLGNPGLEKLWIAIRRAGIAGVTKDEVRSYLSKLGENKFFAHSLLPWAKQPQRTRRFGRKLT